MYTQQRTTRTESVAIDPNAHKWNNGEITQHPTCTEIGKQTLICEYNPAHTSTGDVAKNPEAHKWIDSRVIKDATCTEVGIKEQVCQYDPNHTRQIDIPIDENAHEWDEGIITTQATCSTEGVKTYTCTHNPEHKYNETLEKDNENHNYVGVITTPATCTSDGVKTYTCSNCDASYTEPVEKDPDAHLWNEGVVTTAPTCNENGVKTYTCAHNAEHKKTESIPATGEHSHTKGETIAPTCGEDGYTVYRCSCGDTYNSDIVPATGHIYENGSCKNPNCDQVQILYMVPTTQWRINNVRFAAYFFGNGDTWVSMTDANNDGVYEVTVPQGGYTNVIFCRMDNKNNVNDWGNRKNQTINLDIHSTDENNCFSIGLPNGEGNYEGSWNSFEDISKPKSTEGYLLLRPNSNWTQSNAWFAAYFFGNGEKWVKMTDDDKDGIYQVTIPQGGYTQVIFCRMKSTNLTALNWENKWNQTEDLTIPTDGRNAFAINNDARDNGGGTWSEVKYF